MSPANEDPHEKIHALPMIARGGGYGESPTANLSFAFKIFLFIKIFLKTFYIKYYSNSTP